MKARIAFYFAAVVALVLFLAAAVPSHATQHRDPSLTPDSMQKAAPAPSSAKPTSPSGAPEANTSKSRSASAKSQKQPSAPHTSAQKAGR